MLFAAFLPESDLVIKLQHECWQGSLPLFISSKLWKIKLVTILLLDNMFILK